MKIKRIYCKNAVIIIGKNNLHQSTLNNTEHKMEYCPEMNGYLIDDKCLIPESNINMVLIEPEIAMTVEIAKPKKLKVVA